MILINKALFDTLLQEEKLSIAKFANYLGISRTQAWRVLNQKCSPGEEFIAKFKRAYPKKMFEDYFFVNSVA